MTTTITGRDIQRGDVIKSAAMRHPVTVTALYLSSTGNTVEVVGDGVGYRVGLASKVRLIEREANR